MKRLLCLILVTALLLCAFSLLASCGGKDRGGDETGGGGTDITTAGEVEEVEPAVEYPPFFFDAIELADDTAEEVYGTPFRGDSEKDYRDDLHYTLNDSVSGMPDLVFNPLNCGDDADTLVFGYTASGLFEMRPAESGEGISIVPEMAASAPVDVTSDYAGEYGIESGDAGRAFRITLDDDLVWQDGTPINADTYIYSYKQLLDPLQNNSRASSVTSGIMSIVGAKDYFYSGRSELVMLSELGVLVAEYIALGHTEDELFLDVEGFYGVRLPDGTDEKDAPFGAGFVRITDETPLYDPSDPEGVDTVTARGLYEKYFAEGGEYESFAPHYIYAAVDHEGGVSFDSVGIIKTGEYELVFIFENEVIRPEYSFAEEFFDLLVPEELYESTKKYYDSDGDVVKKNSKYAVKVVSDYGTSPEKYMSCGPYRLVTLVPDRLLTFERSDSWWGYSDGEHYGMYQTDTVNITVIGDREESLEAFLAGDTDAVKLSGSEIGQYGFSERAFTIPGAYTMKLVFNCDSDSLAERGTGILDNLNFRKAFALAIDRASFAASFAGIGRAETGLFNGTYIADAFTCGAYRDSDAAKQAVVRLFELTYGEGGEYDDLDAAYEAATGYDVASATELMDLACEQCAAQGVYEPGQNVELELCVFGSDENSSGIAEFLNDALAKATAGTGFEGCVTVKTREADDVYGEMRAGNTDMIVATWGASGDMFSMLYRYFCDDASGGGSQLEYGFETQRSVVTMTLDGHEFTHSLRDWARWAADVTTLTSKDGELTLGDIGSYAPETRCAIFANLEYAYMSNWASVSLCTRDSAILLSRKVEYGTEIYNEKTGRGGVMYMTYNYDDEAWETAKADVTY